MNPPTALEPRLRPFLRLARLAGADGVGGHELALPMEVRRERSARQSRRLGRLVMRPGPAPAAVDELVIPVEGGRIRARAYRPPGPGPHPLYVFFHGGGWCSGTIDEREPRCRAVAAGAGCVVVSVDYRLAPENQYPTAPEDCYRALTWLVDRAERLGLDPSRVAVGGESAGANLAAVVCLMTRDRDGPAVCHQWLDVPATDLTCRQSGYRDVPDGYLLDRAAIDDFVAHYLVRPEQAVEAYASPLLADDHTGLPPALIMSAGFDKLRGDAEAYAAALADAGVRARHVRLDGHIHLSFALTRLLPSAAEYERQAIGVLGRAFADCRR